MKMRSGLVVMRYRKCFVGCNPTEVVFCRLIHLMQYYSCFISMPFTLCTLFESAASALPTTHPHSFRSSFISPTLHHKSTKPSWNGTYLSNIEIFYYFDRFMKFIVLKADRYKHSTVFTNTHSIHATIEDSFIFIVFNFDKQGVSVC